MAFLTPNYQFDPARSNMRLSGYQYGLSKLIVELLAFFLLSRSTYTSRPKFEENVPTKISAAASCWRSANKSTISAKPCVEERTRKPPPRWSVG